MLLYCFLAFEPRRRPGGVGAHHQYTATSSVHVGKGCIQQAVAEQRAISGLAHWQSQPYSEEGELFRRKK